MSDVEYVAINGILRKLDPHSYMFTPKEFEEFSQNTEGNFGGLGIVISMNESGEIGVVSVMEGTPAEKAGVFAADTIVQINDDSAINMPLSKAVEKMRGEPGTDVDVYIKREGVGQVMKFKITRAVIKVKSVIYAMPEKGVGYIKFTAFQENSYMQMREALDALKKQGMKALVLDMRGNPGGLLNQAIKISDIFLSEGTIVSTVTEDDEKETSLAEAEKDDITDIPLAVLINEGSASAAEIVGAALKKNKRAIVLGRSTFGKGSVQNLFPIPGGRGGLKLTIAQYLTPGDISIQSVGVVPDIELKPSFIDNEKISIFRSGESSFKEANFKEHIVSKYTPKEKDKPFLKITYFKPYLDPEKALKERRKEKVGVFKNDEEITLAAELMKMKIKAPKSDIVNLSKDLKEKEWGNITTKLNSVKVNWKKMSSLKPIDPEKLKIELISDPKLFPGMLNKLKFRATYPGEVENLAAYMDTDIPVLKNTEIIFGSFKNSVEREVPVKLYESMPWRKERVNLILSANDFATTLKEEKIEIETLSMPLPDVKFSYLIEESTGNKNGIIEENESLKLKIWMKNFGKGKLADGRILLINANNTHEVFIKKGNEQVILNPGEEKIVELDFNISKLKDINEKVKIAASLIDYKTRYQAGFSIPFTRVSGKCRYEKSTENPVILKSNASLYSSAEGTQISATMKTDGKEIVTGFCGDFASLKSGFWAKRNDLTNLASDTASSIATPTYSISMPEIEVDSAPVIVENGAAKIDFKLKGSVQDVFVFVNNKKVFYYRAGMNGNKHDFSVPLTLEYKTNRIYIVVKSEDSEKSASAIKYIVYPKGKKDDLDTTEE